MRELHVTGPPDSAAGRARQIVASMDINFQRPRVDDWTPELVKLHVVDAAAVLRRLPSVRVQGYISLWPHMPVELRDLETPEVIRLPLPSAAAISRMEATLGWIAWLEPIDSKIVWMRASGERWKTICWTIGLARAAAHEHWLYALCVIAWRLNGKDRLKHIARRRLIARVRSWEAAKKTTLADTFREDGISIEE